MHQCSPNAKPVVISVAPKCKQKFKIKSFGFVVVEILKHKLRYFRYCA